MRTVIRRWHRCSSCCWVISCNDPRDKDWTRRRRRRTLQGVPCPACHAPSAHPSHPPGLGALRRSSSALPPRQRHRHLANQRQWFRCLASHLLKRRHSPQAATRRSWHAPSRHRDSYDPIPCRRSQRQSPVPKQVIRASPPPHCSSAPQLALSCLACLRGAPGQRTHPRHLRRAAAAHCPLLSTIEVPTVARARWPWSRRRPPPLHGCSSCCSSCTSVRGFPSSCVSSCASSRTPSPPFCPCFCRRVAQRRLQSQTQSRRHYFN